MFCDPFSAPLFYATSAFTSSSSLSLFGGFFNTYSEVSNLRRFFQLFQGISFTFFTVESRVNGDGHWLRVLIPTGRLCPSPGRLTNFDKIWFWSSCINLVNCQDSSPTFRDNLSVPS